MLREEAIAWFTMLKEKFVNTVYEKYLEMAIKALEQEPKAGHWIRKLIRNEKGGCIGAEMNCSKCGEDNGYDKYMNYCPNCGAKME